MIAVWERFRRLNAEDRALTVEAAAALIAVWAGLRIVSVSTLQRVLHRKVSDADSGASFGRASVDRIGWAVAAVARRLPLGFTCLAQALAADAMLRRRGFPSQLRFGVRPPRIEHAPMEAHAWVECDGRIVIGDLADLAEYAALSAPETGTDVDGVRSGSASLTDVMAALMRAEIVPWPAVGATADEFLEACAREDLTGLVYQRLSGSPASSGWPAALYDRLAEEMRAQTASELVRREEIVLVLDALARAGVHPILIKGTPLAYTVYDVPASRPRCDTDLVVPRDTLDRVRGAMAALGYAAPNACDGEFVFGQLRLEKSDRFGVEHAFDFHWRISSQSVFANALTYDELAAHAVPVAALGPVARAAGPLDALLLACLHPVMHHPSAEWLVWIYDVHLLTASLSRAQLDEFGDLAARKGVAAICARQLAFAHSRFETPVPSGLIARLAAAGDREPSATYLRRGRRWHHDFMRNLSGLLGWKDRLRLLREVLFPSPTYMLTAYGVTRRKLGLALVPALYVHRGVNGIWKVLAGRK